MPGIVVDAPVVGAIAFNEPNELEAGTLIQGCEVYAPTLMAFEITNIAIKKIIRNPSERLAIFNGLDTALGSDIHWTGVDFNKTLSLALDTGLTAYDASYLYLAQTLGMPLATFDRKLSSVAQARGIH